MVKLTPFDDEGGWTTCYNDCRFPVNFSSLYANISEPLPGYCEFIEENEEICLWV